MDKAPPPPPKRTPLPLWVPGGIGSVLIGLALTLQALLPPAYLHGAQRRILQAVLLLVILLFAVRGSRDPRHRRGWLGFMGMFGMHLLATLARDFDAPTLLNLAVVLYLPLGVLGFLGWGRESILWAGGIRRVLEGLIFAGSTLALILLGLLDIAPPTQVGHRSLLLDIGVPAILLGVAMFQVRVHPNRLEGPIGWMGLYLFLSNLYNFWQVRLILEGQWSSRHLLAWVDPVMPLIAGMAAFATWPPEVRTRAEGRGQQLSTGIVIYLPFTASLLWLILRALGGEPADPTVTLLMGSMTFLLTIRQVIALRDQVSFSRILSAQLERQRTLLSEREEALLRTQRLNLIATVGAGMAHDLNNLLGSLCTQAERGAPPEDLIPLAHRAAALARKSMAHADNPGQARELFDLRESLTGLAPLLHRFVGRDIQLHLELGEAEAWVETDPLLVEQAMVNLVTNARDALAGPGSIQIALQVGEQELRLTVADDGPGIPADQLPQIFDPFFTTKTRRRGTGLGLPSVKAFVEGLSGRIEVQSAPGTGTTFTLRWPRLAGC